MANYTNLSELMNERMKGGTRVSISDLVTESLEKEIILASEGTLADKADLENGYIDLIDTLYRAGVIKPDLENEVEAHLFRLYETGELAKNGYGGEGGDRFLNVKWIALTDNLPVIVNINT